jgi:1-acyl-sn-glycerol-3-phosphate acyltransferase
MIVLRSLFVWIAGILSMFVMFPFTFITWLLVLPFDHDRRVMHRILIWQSRVYFSLIPVKSFSKSGKEKAVKGKTYVVISNHQSILDILVMNTLGYRYKWISKIENNKVPFLGWYLMMAGYISVDRGNEESKVAMMEKSLDCLRRGTSIMIFPEGTRSLNGEIGFFKRGAFQLAIQENVPILPVVLDGTGGILPKHGLIFGMGHDVIVKVLDPVMPENFGTDKPEELALKLSEIMKKNLAEIRLNKR